MRALNVRKLGLLQSSLYIYSESNWHGYPNHPLVTPTTSWLHLPLFLLRALHVRLRELGHRWGYPASAMMREQPLLVRRAQHVAQKPLADASCIFC